jgi:hypothetical protein
MRRGLTRTNPEPLDHLSPNKRLALSLVFGLGPVVLLLLALFFNWFGVDSGNDPYPQRGGCQQAQGCSR